MSILALNLVLGLEGTPKGWLAGLLVITWVGVLFGLPYMLLASVYGAKQAYLVVAASTFVVLIILGTMWLFGAPGSVPSQGPRGREPAWVPFTATSEQAQDFPSVKSFPNGWDPLTDKDVIYPGEIDAKGEVKTIETVWQEALAERAASQGTTATTPDDWTFRTTQQPANNDEAALPFGRMYFTNKGASKHLLAAIVIPATAKHPETVVFAYRDTGQVFYWAAIILGVSVVLFAAHLGALAWLEKRKKLPVTTPVTA